MRQLLDDEYFPFGSQYYRAPSPPPEDWDRDLGRMADLGFNMVKYWLQWRWNHPSPGEFDFSDIDQLMDLAEKHDLRVMLNTIVDVAPAWIYQQYPDASMVTLDGRRIGPQTQPHRQIGGLGVCFNHEKTMEHMFRFLGACIDRYNDHPAMAIWNVGSEPELTSSMAEMRLWADDAERMGDMLCHCANCESAFTDWLREKYDDLDALNTAWNRNYRSFDEAELPKTRNTFNDVIDWRMFFVDTLGHHMKRRFEVAREHGADEHPLMCHHVFLQGFPTTSTANDPWNVGRFGDLHGFTQMDDPMMCDILRCCARDKPVISAEMLMLMGYTLDLPEAIDANDVKRHIFTGVAANLKGFLFWQYRPELLGREAPTWGLTRLDGETTPWLEAFAETGEVLQDNASFLLDAEPLEAEVALLYHPENQVFAWASSGNEKSATDSLLGTYLALYERNHTLDFVHPQDFEGDADVLDQYSVLYLPFPYFLGETVAEQLKDWVEAGGTLISEAYCAGWDVERGRHHATVPGYGLNEVFQVRQRNAVPPQEHRYVAYHGITRDDGAKAIQGGVTEPSPGGGFVTRQEVDPSNGLGQVEMTMTKDLPHLKTGQKAYGTMAKERFFVEGAEVWAEYADGQPAVTCADYGEGQAILVGSYVGLLNQRGDYPANADFIASLVEGAVGGERPHVVGEARVRVDTLRDGDEVMLVAQNLEERSVDTSVRLPQELTPTLSEQFTDEPLQLTATDDGASLVHLSLEPNEVQVYRG